MIKHSSRQFGTCFQDLVTNMKNLVALAPVLGAILRPVIPAFLSNKSMDEVFSVTDLPESLEMNHQHLWQSPQTQLLHCSLL